MATPDISISEEEFIASYKVTPESTSSSLSGRHVGHYKAVLSNQQIVQMHCGMMSIPFLTGVSPKWWNRMVDIMLQKEAGNAQCHRLRIIALFESDLNQAKRIIVGRKLMHYLENTQTIGEMQYGSQPGKQCPSTVLHKVLLHDISRWTKAPMACIENYAVGCYDRLVNSLVLLVLRKFGFPPSITACFSHLWDNTCHLIKTQYGTSTVHYFSSSSCPLYGPSQGSTYGPVFWIICYVAILHSLDPSLTRAVFLSVYRRVKGSHQFPERTWKKGLSTLDTIQQLPLPSS